MNLLSHCYSLVSDGQENMAGRLDDPIATSFCSSSEAPEHCAFFDADGFHLQFVNISPIVMFGIGNRRLKHLFDDASPFFRAERQDAERFINRQTADLVSYQSTLLV